MDEMDCVKREGLKLMLEYLSMYDYDGLNEPATVKKATECYLNHLSPEKLWFENNLRLLVKIFC